MKDYEEKLIQCLKRQNYICPVCKRVMNQYVQKLDIHHKMRNNKHGKINYPKMLNSLYNIEVVCHECHINHHGSCGKMSDIEAKYIERMIEEENGRPENK